MKKLRLDKFLNMGYKLNVGDSITKLTGGVTKITSSNACIYNSLEHYGVDRRFVHSLIGRVINENHTVVEFPNKEPHKSRGKAIVDAVNYYHVDIEFYSDRDDHPIIEGAIYKARQTGYFLSTIDEPDHEFVCTIEEFNQCVKDMSEFAGAAEYGQYLAHIDIFGIEKLEPVKPRTTPFLQTGEDFEHTKTLNFIRDRMINVHGENSHYDYMHKLNNAIIFMEKTEVYTDVGAKESAKPRTSIEYVKVDGLFWNIAKEYKENKESIFHKSGENYFLIKTLESLVKSHKARNVYRKVETEITWQDAVADYLSKCKYLINNSGCIELDLNSCSTSTELLDEGGKEFIEMCHLVTSMTK